MGQELRGWGTLWEPGPELQPHPLPTRILSAGLLPGASALPYQRTSSVLKAALTRFVRLSLTPGSSLLSAGMTVAGLSLC